MTSSSAQEARLAPGALVGDRFEIEGVAGEDATGVVYRAKDKATSRAATVKVMHRRLMQSREYASRFRRECAAATRVRHPAAARVLATGATEDHLPFVAAEATSGRTLAEALAKDGALPARRAAAVAKSVLSALAAAHRAGVVHRGLEPSLVRVETGADGVERAKILDLGVPRTVTGDVGELTGSIRTRGGAVLGAVKYMAPELLRGETADGRADVYSAGALLYEMLGGKPPFDADDLPAFLATKLNEPAKPLTERFPKAGVPAGLDRLVLTMLEKDSDARPADAAALAAALSPFAGEDAAHAEAGGASMRGVAAAVVGGMIGGAAAVVLAGPRGAQTESIAAVAAAAAVGLGAGAGVAAAVAPRASTADFVRRISVVAAVVGACALASIPMTKASGFFALGVAASCALVALFSYAGHLLVVGTKAHGLRPLAAGVLAPALAFAVAPVLVAPKDHDPYFVGALSASRTDSERDARTQFLLAAASISLSFGLASTLLARPRESAE